MYMIINSSEDKYKLSSSLLKLKCCSLDLDSQSPWHSWRNELFLAFSNSTCTKNKVVVVVVNRKNTVPKNSRMIHVIYKINE